MCAQVAKHLSELPFDVAACCPNGKTNTQKLFPIQCSSFGHISRRPIQCCHFYSTPCNIRMEDDQRLLGDKISNKPWQICLDLKTTNTKNSSTTTKPRSNMQCIAKAFIWSMLTFEIPWACVLVPKFLFGLKKKSLQKRRVWNRMSLIVKVRRNVRNRKKFKCYLTVLRYFKNLSPVKPRILW